MSKLLRYLQLRYLQLCYNFSPLSNTNHDAYQQYSRYTVIV